MAETQTKTVSERKRDAIVEAAVDVFIERGLDGASMDRVAEVAGVSKRTVYNHFKSKDGLFQAVIAEFLAVRDQRKPITYSPTESVESQLREFINAELYLVDDPRRRGLSRLLTSVFIKDPKLGAMTRGGFNPYQVFLTWLAAAAEDGKVTIESPMLAARVFYGLVEGCLTWGAMISNGASISDSAVVEAMSDEITATFMARFGA